MFIVLEFVKVLVLLAVALFFTTSALRMLNKDHLRVRYVGSEGNDSLFVKARSSLLYDDEPWPLGSHELFDLLHLSPSR